MEDEFSFENGPFSGGHVNFFGGVTARTRGKIFRPEIAPQRNVSWVTRFLLMVTMTIGYAITLPNNSHSTWQEAETQTETHLATSLIFRGEMLG